MRTNKTSEDTTAKKIREGRGTGRGPDWKPWIVHGEFPSKGRIHRIKALTSGRTCFFPSDIERNSFAIYDFAHKTRDVREQHPLLPLDETLAIAKQLGIRHPYDHKARELVVMTTDLIVTVVQGDESVDQARNCKYANMITPRVIEKMEIERRYWDSRGVEWGVVTERQIPPYLVRNVDWLRGCRDLDALHPLSRETVEKLARQITGEYLEGTVSLAETCLKLDDVLGMDGGACLSIARYLMASGLWVVDLLVPLIPRTRIEILSVDPSLAR